MRLWLKVDERPSYDKALLALSEAHTACFKHEDRDVLGMSHGPFSGVNKALGIVLSLETLARNQQDEIANLKLKLINKEKEALDADPYREPTELHP